MTAFEKFELATRLLKEVNCPEKIMDALWLFGMTIKREETKLHDWNALADGKMIEGEVIKGSESIGGNLWQ